MQALAKMPEPDKSASVSGLGNLNFSQAASQNQDYPVNC